MKSSAAAAVAATVSKNNKSSFSNVNYYYECKDLEEIKELKNQEFMHSTISLILLGIVASIIIFGFCKLIAKLS